MNDFSELENDLKALRPAQPSPVLFERVEEAMADLTVSTATDATGWRGWHRRLTLWNHGDASQPDLQLDRMTEQERGSQRPYKFGIGLVAAAAAAVLLLLARINTDQTRNENKEIAQVSPRSETTQILPDTQKLGQTGAVRSHSGAATSLSKFVPTGAMQVVYNERDEGLQFTDSSAQPVRRLRYQTQQTWQWRNPKTGASLRVSYPSEEVVLIPVSGQ
jgi:hypothetical protein